MRRTLLHRLPIFAAAGGVVFFFLASLWNYAVERDHPKWRLRSANPLAGVAKPAPTEVSLDRILSGETQKSFSDNLAQSLPVFPFAVRARNQLLYSLFGASGASGLVIGRGEQLFERFYIDEFCRRGAAPNETTLSTLGAARRRDRGRRPCARKRLRLSDLAVQGVAISAIFPRWHEMPGAGARNHRQARALSRGARRARASLRRCAGPARSAQNRIST